MSCHAGRSLHEVVSTDGAGWERVQNRGCYGARSGGRVQAFGVAVGAVTRFALAFRLVSRDVAWRSFGKASSEKERLWLESVTEMADKKRRRSMTTIGGGSVGPGGSP